MKQDTDNDNVVVIRTKNGATARIVKLKQKSERVPRSEEELRKTEAIEKGRQLLERNVAFTVENLRRVGLGTKRAIQVYKLLKKFTL